MKMLPCFQFFGDKPLERFLHLPMLSLSSIWNSQCQVSSLSCSLSISEELVVLCASGSPDTHSRALGESGEFREGLWEGAVVECFIGLEGSSDYLELNLSPAGAWWGCFFEGVRVRSGSRVLEAAIGTTFSFSSAEGWTSLLCFSGAADYLAYKERLRVNLTAINEDREFFSYAALAGETPDFHQPQAFITPNFIPFF